jgi:ABC-2 type transport system ATP-binding protein
METIIRIHGLTKTFKVPIREKTGVFSAMRALLRNTYKSVHALDSVDLEIPKGEIHGIIGPNGAGKSTLTKIISGVLYPTSGEVNISGFVPWKDRQTYVKRIGVLFGQKSQLWWDLPVVDSFELNRKLYGIDRAEFNKSLEAMVELLKVSAVISRPVRLLSLGERMKCELISILLHKPELIYLDEPTIGMDIMAKEAIRQFIKEINRTRETTVLLTSHDLRDIEDLCARITVLNEGKIVFSGRTEDIRRLYSDKQVLTIKFHSRIDKKDLSDIDAISVGEDEIAVEVDSDPSAINTIVTKIIGKHNIRDIGFDAPSIESVIKKIYRSFEN